MSWLTKGGDALAAGCARAAMWVYPPYELRRLGPFSPPPAEDTEAPAHRGKRWAGSEVQQTQLAAAEMIYRGELDRKKTIEDKAANFLAGATLSSGILIALPTLLVEKTSAPVVGRFFVLALFMTAVAYLVGAAMYAIRVRASGEFYVVNSSSLEGLALTSDDFRRKWAVQLVDMARRNQGFLLRKTNELYVAEQLFLRGLQSAFVAGLLLAALAIAYPPGGEQWKARAEDSPTAVLFDRLAKCHETNSDLNVQIAAQASALGELKARLDANLKGSHQVRKKIRASTSSSSNQLSRNAVPAAPQQGCPAPPVGKAPATAPVPDGEPTDRSPRTPDIGAPTQ